jgi:hypothetical protein
MRSFTKYLRPQTALRINQSFLRGSNPWDVGSPYLPRDEHEPPKQEEILSKYINKYIDY